MCGICGIYKKDGSNADSNTLRLMADKMVFRGPDDEGFFVYKHMGLGIRRLSIIDVEGGHQPISNEDGTIYLVMNGEIYNYIELRQDLKATGHIFRTNSDSEVLVHLFEEYGVASFEKLNGMYGFALWDQNNECLYLGRDRLGIKPLYYFSDSKSFIFSSNLSSLTSVSKTREADYSAFLDYMVLAFIPHPKTAFKGILKLSPGSYIELRRNAEPEIRRYCGLEGSATSEIKDHREYAEEVLHLFKDTLRIQMRSDVPVGFFLSGGLDSSSLVAVASGLNKNIKTFSIGFVNGLNELPFARLVAEKFKTQHSEIIIGKDDISRGLFELINYLDEPVGDNSIIPTYIISRHAAKAGVKVVLTGAGGDEIFGGYRRHILSRVLGFIYSQPSFLRKGLTGLCGCVNKDMALRLSDWRFNTLYSMSGASHTMLKSLFLKQQDYDTALVSAFSLLGAYCSDQADYSANSMRIDLNTYLVDDILALTDKMTMAASLEARVPYLDHRLVELASKIPTKIKLNHRQNKWLQKDIFKEYLPKELLALPKAGFSGPMASWVNHLRKDIVRSLLEKPNKFYRQHINIDLLKKSFSGNLNANQLTSFWYLFIYDLWYKKNIENGLQ